MGIHEAELGMSRLEQRAPFDESKAATYFALIREYVKRKLTAYGNSSPVLVDVTSGTVQLPPALTDRIERWMRDQSESSPHMIQFARYYLLSLLVGGPAAEMYEPLATFVAEGGDFYLENGIFFVRECIRVPGTLVT